MSDLVRLTFSLEPSLADAMHRALSKHGYENRSEFLRDLIRQRLVEDQWHSDQEVVASVTMIYSHHTPGLSDWLTHVQHEHHNAVLATMHVHLDEHLCAEVTLMRGKASELKHLADNLQRRKGVLHAAVSMSTTGEGLT